MSGLSCASLRAQGKVSSLPCPLGRDCPDHPGKLSFYDKEPAPSEAAKRKAQPLFSGVLKYFPDALLAVAECSRAGNDQHNPGQPLHWDRAKSTDELDALARHLLDEARGTHIDSDGVAHLAKVAWRALAALQKACEQARHMPSGVERNVAAAPKPLPRFVAPMPLVVGKHYRILSLGVDGAPQHAVGDILLCAAEGEYLHNGINYYDRKGIKCYFAKKTKEGGTWIHEVEQID